MERARIVEIRKPVVQKKMNTDDPTFFSSM
jgi:hypothetical protein